MKPSDAHHFTPEETLPPSAHIQSEERRAKIAERAYRLWQKRAPDSGSALEDWLQAEQEIDAQATRKN